MKRDRVQLGDPAPDFTLPTPWGVTVALRDLLLKGPVVLEFLRGTWDPNSRARLVELEKWREPVKAHAARVLFVTCERAVTARESLEARPTLLSLLVDESHTTARAYGVFRRFSYGALNVARSATFVIDRCGFVRYAHLGTSPIRTAPFEEIVETLRAIEEEGGRAPA